MKPRLVHAARRRRTLPEVAIDWITDDHHPRAGIALWVTLSLLFGLLLGAQLVLHRV